MITFDEEVAQSMIACSSGRHGVGSAIRFSSKSIIKKEILERDGWRGSRVLLAGALLGVMFTLAACSSAPPRRAPGATTADGAPLPTRRQGGYYADDGPGDNPPADLAAIPDAAPRREPLLTRANRPYVVFGRQYVPMNDLAPYRERGVASWYGRKFHGQRTSSGEVYDMYGMTAAHPTLPIPSYVRVISMRTGNAVIVRVNDRGPFLNNRLIDLSYTAAAKLGYLNAGSTEVEVELLTRFDGIDAAPVQLAARPAAPDREKPRAASLSIESIIAADAAAAGSSVSMNAPASVSMPASVSTPGSTGSSVSTGTPASASASPYASAGTPASPGTSTSASGPTSAGSPAPVSGDVAASPVTVSAAYAEPATTTSSNPRGLFVQLGAFTSRDNAEAARLRLAGLLDWLASRIEVRQEGSRYKVQAGPFAQRAEAQAALERIRLATDMQVFATGRP